VRDRLLLYFDAFFLEHRRCGDLNGGASSERAWLACGACSAGSSSQLGRRSVAGRITLAVRCAMLHTLGALVVKSPQSLPFKRERDELAPKISD